MSNIVLEKSKIEQINDLTDTLKNSYSFWETAPVGTSCSLFEFKAEYLFEQGYRKKDIILSSFLNYLDDKLFELDRIAILSQKDLYRIFEAFKKLDK